MRDARPRRIPLLDRVAANLPGGSGSREPRAGSTTTTGWSTSSSRTGSTPTSLSTTGTCRKRSRIAADGRSARSSTRSWSTPTLSRRAWRIASPGGSRTTSPGSPHGSATERESTRPDVGARRTRSPPRTTSSSRMASPPTCSGANGAASVGITLDLIPMHPLTSSEADVAAAQREDGIRNRWFLDPVIRGAYPEDVVELWEDDLPDIADGDLSAIARHSTSSA